MSDGEERERLVAEVDGSLKRRAKADPRPIREVVEASLQREFSTGKAAAVERRIDEQRQRIQTLEREINERERELAQEREELERYEQMLQEFQERNDGLIEEANDALEGTPLEPDNPAVKNWAEEIGIPPTELVHELEERRRTGE